MKSKPILIVSGILLSLVLLVGIFSAGFMAGWFFSEPNRQQAGFPGFSITTDRANSPSQTDNESLGRPFWQAFDIVHDFFVDQPVDDEKLMQGAIRGMLESLGDPHTTYMDPKQYTDATTDLSGEYEGIGAWVNVDGDFLTIIEPIKGSPAEAAGLLPGDQIIAVNGEDMTGILPEVVRQKVLGPRGSEVTLSIRRTDQLDVENIFDVTIRRASIQVASVESEMLEGGIAYIRMRNFGERTDRELRTQLGDLMKQNPNGLILDLRNNTGGFLNVAINVASEFISEGVIMYEDYGDGTRDILNAKKGGLATEIPLVVLVNEFSASASEVVAGAIQDYERGTLVGVTTFGKGSVQQWIPLDKDQGAVRVTIARWLTPEERQISEIGLTPEVEVERTEEDFREGRDPQLDKAIEILTESN
jgi:carboxyl-terminal processing protease